MGCQQLGVDAAIQLLNPQRHIPNAIIVELGASLVDDSHMLSAFAEWQSANKYTKLANYLDDIEREFDALEEQGARNRIVDK